MRRNSPDKLILHKIFENFKFFLTDPRNIKEKTYFLEGSRRTEECQDSKRR